MHHMEISSIDKKAILKEISDCELSLLGFQKEFIPILNHLRMIYKSFYMRCVQMYVYYYIQMWVNHHAMPWALFYAKHVVIPNLLYIWITKYRWVLPTSKLSNTKGSLYKLITHIHAETLGTKDQSTCWTSTTLLGGSGCLGTSPMPIS